MNFSSGIFFYNFSYSFIITDALINVEKIHDEYVLKVPYDYESIIHYPENSYSKNGNLTIITKDKKYQKIIGTKKVLSNKDILKIKKK
ncbi:UNVERIFIED_CONTAM: hypothetical protein RMT77_002808 [Armadillidium vulgare]